ncbi:MAG: response regulator [Cytophagales bacterium]|nr:MAG: response regulator [Cytophagales bacterium]
MKNKILIVDDSLYMRTIIKDALAGAGFEIVGMAASGETAIDMAIELQPDLITLDNILPDMLGLDILNVLKEEEIESKIVMISAVGQESVIEEGIKRGATQYLVKPFTTEQLVNAVKNALK